MPKKSGNKEESEISKRLTVAFSIKTRKRLEQLVEQTGSPTVTSLLLDALRLYEWYNDAQKEGAEILIRRPNQEPVAVEFLFSSRSRLH